MPPHPPFAIPALIGSIGWTADLRRSHGERPRWKLRRAVKLVSEILGSLRLEKRPDKTFIDRIERGFPRNGPRGQMPVG